MTNNPVRPFGFARDEFSLDRTWTFLNHGSFGAVPRGIRTAQDRWRDELEAQPVAFLARRYWSEVDRARQAVAPFLGARPADTVFVHNATAGVQAVVGSLELEAGDQLVTTSHRYDAVHRCLTHAADKVGAQVVEVDPGHCPTETSFADAILAVVTPRTRLCVVDAITSPTALVLPIQETVRRLREGGVPVLVDGAHAAGQIDVDLGILGADYWVGNLHKWMCSPRGCAVLVARADHHDSLRPAITSHGHKLGLHMEFDWPGTFDPSPWLTAPAAIQQHLDWGGPLLRQAHRRLVSHYRQRLHETLGLPEPVPPGQLWSGSMAAVPIGLPTAARFEAQAWLAERRIEVPMVPFEGQIWVRVSAFAAYNTEADIEPLIDVLPELQAAFPRTYRSQGC